MKNFLVHSSLIAGFILIILIFEVLKTWIQLTLRQP